VHPGTLLALRDAVTEDDGGGYERCIPR
jgi:hypothetical protein